jgi:hypothetical protein
MADQNLPKVWFLAVCACHFVYTGMFVFIVLHAFLSTFPIVFIVLNTIFIFMFVF